MINNNLCFDILSLLVGFFYPNFFYSFFFFLNSNPNQFVFNIQSLFKITYAEFLLGELFSLYSILNQYNFQEKRNQETYRVAPYKK